MDRWSRQKELHRQRAWCERGSGRWSTRGKDRVPGTLCVKDTVASDELGGGVGGQWRAFQARQRLWARILRAEGAAALLGGGETW